ncbi:CPBP family intramembrane metalloprotease [Listeria seeligeri]|uniref:CPBP family intramembrane glutamic endopeptidase n=1 Tax=Listeria seeligeri TaxID=1640 RepID=UPI001887ECCC|nr:CPBP family intramembrane glutamic endopeptidase [Listeria seeligeri]MBF2480196.1 CPBP family intramembrane metalloprotease [Listeria seeligeri]
MYILFVIFFLISLFLSRIIRKYVRGNVVVRLIRILLMGCSYLLIFIFIPFPKINFEVSISFLLVVILLSIVFILFDCKQLLQSNRRGLFAFLPKVKGEQLISRFGEVSIIPIVEELFFRGTIPFEASNFHTVLMVFLSTVLFSIAHYFGNDKTVKYHVILCLFSITSAGIYIFSENIIYSIVFHIIFNMPWFITNVRVYLYQKERERRKNAI